MDYQDIIKLEEQSPIYSTGNQSNGLKHCMAYFYDNDSDFQNKDALQEIHFADNHCFQKAIDQVSNYIDIVDSPLEDIVNYLNRLQLGENLDKMILRKKIIKRKNFLKRYRAKNRQPKIYIAYEQFSMPTLVNNGETQAEIKKKRNRVSAQVSRDRKKQYFQELEQKNFKLEEEIIRAKLQNQKLKKQIHDNTSKPKNRAFSDTLNNKLTRLLIFLGIICLIGMLKQTFFSTKENLSKLQSSLKLDQSDLFTSLQHEKMIEQSQRKVAEFLEEPELEKELFNNQYRKVQFETDSPHQGSKRYQFFSSLIEKLDDMKKIVQLKNVEL